MQWILGQGYAQVHVCLPPFLLVHPTPHSLCRRLCLSPQCLPPQMSPVRVCHVPSRRSQHCPPSWISVSRCLDSRLLLSPRPWLRQIPTMVARAPAPPVCCSLMVSLFQTDLVPVLHPAQLPTSSCSFLPGDLDPWHVLSVTQALGPSVPALLIPGASHCSDMAPERPSDSPSIHHGRQVGDECWR